MFLELLTQTFATSGPPYHSDQADSTVKEILNNKTNNGRTA